MDKIGFSIEFAGHGISLGIWGKDIKKPIYKERLAKIAELAKDDDGVILEQITEGHFIIVICEFDGNSEPKLNKELKKQIHKLIDSITEQFELGMFRKYVK